MIGKILMLNKISLTKIVDTTPFRGAASETLHKLLNASKRSQFSFLKYMYISVWGYCPHSHLKEDSILDGQQIVT